MEIWKTLSDFPNYAVSSEGRVKNKRNDYILKPFPDRYGYLRLSIGNTDNVYIHKLVAEEFIEKPHSKKPLVVNHKDSNTKNNFVDNLEWVTNSENIKHGYSKGHIDVKKASLAAVEVNRRPVYIVETKQEFGSVKECAEYLGVNQSAVNRVLNGTRIKLHGFTIEYAYKKRRKK